MFVPAALLAFIICYIYDLEQLVGPNAGNTH